MLNIFKNRPVFTCNQIANTLDLPEQYVNKACEAYGYPEPIAYSTEATRNNYSGALPMVELHDHDVTSLQTENLGYLAARRR